MTNTKNIVCKCNRLVTAKYSLSEQEQKIILTLASKVKKDDEDFKTYSFSVSELSELFGKKLNYKQTKKIIDGLFDKSFSFTDDEKTYKYHWIGTAIYHDKEGRFDLKLGEETKDYFLKLSTYCKYHLGNILTLESKYSIRIYEILKSNNFKTFTDVIYDVSHLQDILECNYPLYANFKQKVLNQAQKEINNKTDIKFEFEEIKQGRKVISVKFKIESLETKIEPNKDKLSAPLKKPKQYEEKVPQYKDFNQRKYDKDFFDSLYKNVNMQFEDKI